MAIETVKAEGWLQEALEAHPTIAAAGLKVYAYRAPADAAAPLILFHYVPGYDVQGVGTARSLTVADYVVKLVTAGPATDALVAVADAIDEVVGKASREVYDGYVITGYRLRPVSYREPVRGDDVEYQYLGGEFRLWISKNS